MSNNENLNINDKIDDNLKDNQQNNEVKMDLSDTSNNSELMKTEESQTMSSSALKMKKKVDKYV